MSYATQQNLLDREGEDVIFAVADRDRDGVLDAVAIERALVDASAEIDGYLSMRFTLPLPAAPAWAVQICGDIAIYRLARSADALTRELRQRYEDAIAFLKNVSNGKAGLGLAEPDLPPAGESGDVRGGEILVQAEERLFSRSGLRRI